MHGDSQEYSSQVDNFLRRKRCQVYFVASAAAIRIRTFRTKARRRTMRISPTTRPAESAPSGGAAGSISTSVMTTSIARFCAMRRAVSRMSRLAMGPRHRRQSAGPRAHHGVRPAVAGELGEFQRARHGLLPVRRGLPAHAAHLSGWVLRQLRV